MNIANGLHCLVRLPGLVLWLADIGGVAAIGHLLQLPDGSDFRDFIPIVTDALSALRIFVKTSEKLKVEGKPPQCIIPELT